MKAEREDRRSRRKSGSSFVQKMLVVGTISAITMGLAYLYVPRIHIAIDSRNGSITITKRENRSITVPAQKTAEQARQSYAYAPVPPQELIVESREKQAATRQTEFNDSNYTPRGAINSMQPPPQIAYYQPTPRQQIRQSNRQIHSAHWEWDTGHNKKKVWGQFQWVESNGSIEWGSVCQNYRRGSIEYRDCRKGAKVALINMCGRYKPACMAQNGFRP